MLNFNEPLPKSTIAEPHWKALIYDRFGQDIISPLFTVGELRDKGVTIHLLLHAARDVLQDVPAIYIVSPTPENITRICQDFENQLYSDYYLNFLSALPRGALEQLAEAAVQFGVAPQIKKCYDQYLNFVSIENDMFVLKHQITDNISYYAINRGSVKDTDIEMTVGEIVDCLFCVFTTLGIPPIIRCPSGNAAEMVGEQLDRRMRENLRDTKNSLFAGDVSSFSMQRPLLVILDRNMDLATPLHHTWTYQALAHDVLDYKLNRIDLEEDSTDDASGRQKKRKKTYDLSASDQFWQNHKGSPFPTVADNVQKELEAYRASESEITKLKSALGLEGEDDEAIAYMSDSTAMLTSAVSSLPELLEKKRLIDLHTTVAMAVLEQVKNRKLDLFFEMEEKLMSQQATEKSLMEVLSDSEAGTPDDRLRLFIIALLCGPPISDSDADQYSVALEQNGCDITPVKYIRRWKAYTKMTTNYSSGDKASSASYLPRAFSMTHDFVQGMKNMVVGKRDLPVTKIVDALMSHKTNGSGVDDYRYFDPKIIRADASNPPRTKNPHSEAIVFVVGGGNFIEYQNLVDYATAKGRHVVYGCTDLVNSDQFLTYLKQLGNEIK